MPEWLGSGLLTGLAGALGYVAKIAIDHLRAHRSSRRQTIERLENLRDLLRDAKSVFRSQNFLARRLASLVKANHPNEVAAAVGFDARFLAAHAHMDDEERELHALIRSTTVNSMKRLNTELQAWLTTHRAAVRELAKFPGAIELLEDLDLLSLHLNQWFDKFGALMADQRRALIYLADEKKQGVGFPSRLDASLLRTLDELSA